MALVWGSDVSFPDPDDGRQIPTMRYGVPDRWHLYRVVT
jgi:hypothetical protein